MGKIFFSLVILFFVTSNVNAEIPGFPWAGTTLQNFNSKGYDVITMECPGKKSETLECVFHKLLLLPKSSEEQVAQDISELLLNKSLEDLEKVFYGKGGVCSSLSDEKGKMFREKTIFNKKYYSNEEIDSHKSKFFKIESICKNREYSELLDFSIQSIKDEANSCTITNKNWTEDFSLKNGKWVSVTEPNGLCGVVHIATLNHIQEYSVAVSSENSDEESVKGFDPYWEYRTKSTSTNSDNIFCERYAEFYEKRGWTPCVRIHVRSVI